MTKIDVRIEKTGLVWGAFAVALAGTMLGAIELAATIASFEWALSRWFDVNPMFLKYVLVLSLIATGVAWYFWMGVAYRAEKQSFLQSGLSNSDRKIPI
jgi:hypothetical protein